MLPGKERRSPSLKTMSLLHVVQRSSINWQIWSYQPLSSMVSTPYHLSSSGVHLRMNNRVSQTRIYASEYLISTSCLLAKSQNYSNDIWQLLLTNHISFIPQTPVKSFIGSYASFLHHFRITWNAWIYYGVLPQSSLIIWPLLFSMQGLCGH